MSTWNDLADAIAAQLRTLSVMAGVDVIVDRQKSISSEVDAAVGKAKGACVTILYERAEITADARPMVTRPSYSIRLYTVPVIRDNDHAAIAADDILEALLPALHDWHPDPAAHTSHRLKVTSDPDLLPDRHYLIYEFTVTGLTALPEPYFLS